MGLKKQEALNYHSIQRNSSNIIKKRSVKILSHSQDPHHAFSIDLDLSHDDQFYSSLDIEKMIDNSENESILEQEFRQLNIFSNFGIFICQQTMKDGKGVIVDNAKCGEIQRVSTPTFLAVDIASTSKIQ